MSNEYYAVIFEFNSQEIKLGFAGESAEHARVTPESPLWKKLVPSSAPGLALPAFLQVDSHALPARLRDELLDSLTSSDVFKDLLDSYVRDRDDLKWYDWHSDDYVALSTIVKALLTTRLLVSPLKTKLFTIDCAMSAVSKSMFCKAFLGLQTAVSITFLPFSPCCCIAAGVVNALVVSLDWASCRVAPVLDLRCLPPKEYVQFSSESIHYSPAIRHGQKTFEDIELEIFENDRFMEMALFSRGGLPAVVAAFVRSLEVDSRAPVAANVIFTGLKSDIPGMKGRLLTEIAVHLPGYEVSGKKCLGAWAGASLYCSTTLLKENSSKWGHMEISRLNFEKTGACILEEYHA